MTDLTFEVLGVPAPQGSKKIGRNRRTGQPITLEDNPRLRPWRSVVTWEVRAARGGAPRFEGPLMLLLTFRFPRPKYHYGTGRNAGKLKPNAPYYHSVAPDGDKLVRAVCDALKVAGAYKDDGQVAYHRAWKIYADPPDLPGVRATLGPAPDPRRLHDANR